jgi:hypothetical protein
VPLSRPLAIGLLQFDAGACRREATAARVALALTVNDLGLRFYAAAAAGARRWLPAADESRTLVLLAARWAECHDPQAYLV